MRADSDLPPPRRRPPRRARRTPRPQPAHELGVLFVHGIGEQERGATLVTGGEALHTWFRRWFEGIARSWLTAGLEFEQWREWFPRTQRVWRARGEGGEITRRFEALRSLLGNMRDSKDPGQLPPLETVTNEIADGILAATVTVRDARLRTVADEAPSHAPLELLAVGTDGEVHRSRWLLAESWWAQAFAEPTFRQLGIWLVQILPWTLGSHFGSRVRRAFRNVRTGGGAWRRLGALLDLASNFALLALSIPLAVLAEALVLVVLLLALFPIPRLRSALAAFERALAATLGDSLVLLANPLQRAAMVAQIQRDAAWLATRCKTVAVVAHSQGAALAHVALRENRPPNVKLLFTFGSGLRKLEELRQVSLTDEGAGGRAYLTAVSVGLLGWSAVSVLLHRSGWSSWTTWVGLLLLGGMLASYLVRFTPIDIGWFSARFDEGGLSWVDHYASADPVPNGALQDYEPELTLPRSVRIFNERSFARDHTTYWRNSEQFVGPLAWWLTCFVDGPWRRIAASQPPVWVRAGVRRRWRVTALAAARWIGIASGLWLLYARRAEWRAVLSWLRSLAAGALDRLLPWFSFPSKAPRPGLATLAVTAGALLALYALGRAGRLAWERWSEHELRAYFSRRAAGVGPPAGAGMATVRAQQTASQAFTTMWIFFSFACGQLAFAAMLTPRLADRAPTWLGAANGASLVAFVVAVVFQWSVKRAAARALARPPV